LRCRAGRLPADVTFRLNQAVPKMLEEPDVRKRMERDAIETRAMTSGEFTQFVASDIANGRRSPNA